MRKKIEYAVILVIIISIGYLLLTQATFKTEVSKKIPVTIYENDEYSYDSAVIIDGTIINYLLSPRQRFSGIFKLEDFSDHTPTIFIKWSEDNDVLMQSITSPDRSRFDFWMLIDRDMNSFALSYDDNKKAATSDEMLKTYEEISKNYHSEEN